VHENGRRRKTSDDFSLPVHLQKKSDSFLGGDGWAYCINFAVLAFVLHMGTNLNSGAVVGFAGESGMRWGRRRWGSMECALTVAVPVRWVR
jgi:hypothetical protein